MSGAVTLRFGRLPEGPRVALAFTCRDALDRVLGTGHPAIRLAPAALRAMLAPLGVTEIRVDVAGALDPAVLVPAASGILAPVRSAA
ncbi:SAV_915 family protein [Actinocorallia aurea]